MASGMQCPACGSGRCAEVWQAGDRLFRTTAETFRMRRCAACGVLFLAPPPRPEDLARYYPETYWTGAACRDGGGTLRRRLANRYRRAVLRSHVRFVSRVVAEQRQRGVRVRLLDVGCGDGSVLEALGVPSAVGLDSAPGAVRATRARGLDAVRGTLVARPFRPASFSLVTMFHVLEHVPDVTPHLEAVWGLLQDGGDLVVQVPNAASWQGRCLGERWAGFDVPRHLVNYPPRVLRCLLGRHGFAVVRTTQLCLRDNTALLASSLLPGLYPPARAARRQAEAPLAAWARDLAFLAATLAALPVTLVESLVGRGATIMVHARRAA